jgi:anti-sigma factor ChrR (cupin superfamily)
VAEILGWHSRSTRCIKSAERTSSKVTHHPSTSQLQRFSVGALAEDELTAVAIHVANCAACHQRFVEELRGKQGSGPFTFSLAPEVCFRDDHLDFDQLVDLADEKLDQYTREIIDVHLTTCERCREDVRSFLAFRKADTRAAEESCIEAE